MSNFQEKSNFIWNLADLLRGSYKRNEYQKVILPFTVLKRFDSVLEYSKQNVLDNYNKYKTWWEDLNCIKTIKTKDNIEGLVEELFYKKRNMNTENMTETEFRHLSNVKEYMKNALLFIEKFYDMYGEYSK